MKTITIEEMTETVRYRLSQEILAMDNGGNPDNYTGNESLDCVDDELECIRDNDGYEDLEDCIIGLYNFYISKGVFEPIEYLDEAGA